MLPPRKSDPWAELESKVWHSVMREQSGTPSLRIVTDEGITILPYAYFQEAHCRRHGETWEIVLHWPSVVVIVKGRSMEKMPGLIAEQGLALLEFHPQGDKHAQDELPEFESITLTARLEDPSLSPPAANKPRGGPVAAERQCYSVA